MGDGDVASEDGAQEEGGGGEDVWALRNVGASEARAIRGPSRPLAQLCPPEVDVGLPLGRAEDVGRGGKDGKDADCGLHEGGVGLKVDVVLGGHLFQSSIPEISVGGWSDAGRRERWVVRRSDIISPQKQSA